MIYLARFGKTFGPFTPDELASIRLEDYSWILDSRKNPQEWIAIDPAPVLQPHSESEIARHALVFSPHFPTAIRGKLTQVQLERGTLLTDESQVRLEAGSPIQLQLEGRPAVRAFIEGVRFLQGKVTYLLRWGATDAPDLHGGALAGSPRM